MKRIKELLSRGNASIHFQRIGPWCWKHAYSSLDAWLTGVLAKGRLKHKTCEDNAVCSNFKWFYDTDGTIVRSRTTKVLSIRKRTSQEPQWRYECTLGRLSFQKYLEGLSEAQIPQPVVTKSHILLLLDTYSDYLDFWTAEEEIKIIRWHTSVILLIFSC